MTLSLQSKRHGDRREPKRLQAGEVPFSLNPYAIIIDESQERVERGEKRREAVYFFQYIRHGMRRGIERSDTQESTVPKRLVGYHDLGALNALRHP
jgi:hypothetical protein